MIGFLGAVQTAINAAGLLAAREVARAGTPTQESGASL